MRTALRVFEDAAPVRCTCDERAAEYLNTRTDDGWINLRPLFAVGGRIGARGRVRAIFRDRRKTLRNFPRETQVVRRLHRRPWPARRTKCFQRDSEQPIAKVGERAAVNVPLPGRIGRMPAAVSSFRRVRRNGSSCTRTSGHLLRPSGLH